MKSAVFYGKHDMRVEDSPVPPVGAKDVLIRVKYCGVCGTDVHIYEGDQGSADVTPPVILGHEFSGIVEQVGAEVTGFRPGDRVCIDPNNYCGSCGPCRSGEVHFCTQMIGYGTTANGGFAEFCVVPEKQVYRLGPNTTFAQGAMAEPVACCLHGIDLCEIRPGSSVVVIGGGMIGLLMVQLSKLSGASRVVLLEPVEAKRAAGKRLGADLCVDPLNEDVHAIMKGSGGAPETVIECAGRPDTMAQAIEIAGNKGLVMLFGLTAPDETIPVKPFEIFRKELTIKASFVNPCTQQRALNLIDSGRLDVESMICETRGLEGLAEVLGSPALRARGKYLISPC